MKGRSKEGKEIKERKDGNEKLKMKGEESEKEVEGKGKKEKEM